MTFKKHYKSLIILCSFFIGLFLFDTFSNKENIQKQPRSNDLKTILESSHTEILGFWESDGTYLMIGGASKPNITKFSPNEKEVNLGPLDIHKSSQHSYKAKFEESKEKIQIEVNENGNQLTITHSGEEPITYTAVEEIPAEVTSTIE